MIPADDKRGQQTTENNSSTEQKLAENPNPRANENIRERNDEPYTQGSDLSDEVGSEITDGEDA